MQELVPQAEASFEEWWRLATQHVEGLAKKGFNSLVILGAWSIWKHRNRCVFDDLRPSVGVALQLARDEAWCGPWLEVRVFPHSSLWHVWAGFSQMPLGVVVCLRSHR
jgi:hypothetical protein